MARSVGRTSSHSRQRAGALVAPRVPARAGCLARGPPPAMLMVGLLAVWLLAQEGIPLVFVVATVGIVAGVALSFALLPLRRPPSDRQIARFIEEQAGGLDEVVVTAVDKLAVGLRTGRRTPGRRCDSRGAHASIRIASFTDDTMSRAAIGAAIGSAAFLDRVLVLRAVGGARVRCRRLVPVPALLRDRSDAGLDQGARGPAGHRHRAHSRHRRWTGAVDHGWSGRRGPFGADDARVRRPMNSRSR